MKRSKPNVREGVGFMENLFKTVLSLVFLFFFFFQSYIKEPFRARREALRSSFTEVEGVGKGFFIITSQTH